MARQTGSRLLQHLFGNLGDEQPVGSVTGLTVHQNCGDPLKCPGGMKPMQPFENLLRFTADAGRDFVKG
ncbi:hypothetical protein D3C79_1098320 [compost metagenome]